MDVIKSLAGMVLVFLAAVLVVDLMSSLSTLNSNTGAQGINYVGTVCPKIIRSSGRVEDLGCGHNLLMNEGKNFIEEEIGNGTASTNIVDVMFLGNGTTWGTSDMTVHTGEIIECGLGAATGLSANDIGNGNWSFTNTWTSSCAGVIVNTTGLNCSACAEGTEFFAGNNFTSVTLQTNDQINVTWYVFVT